MYNKKLVVSILTLTLVFSLASCTKKLDKDSGDSQTKKENRTDKGKTIGVNPELVNKDGDTIEKRYNPPKGYKRVKADKYTFTNFVRNEKLKPYGQKSIYYNGKPKKSEGVYDAVFDVDLEGKNILHCADSCYKFRGDYLYSIGRYDKMKFHFVGKGIADFDKYTKGYRVDPETGEYFLMGEKSSDAKVYKKFMDTVYIYSSTISLVEDTKKVKIDDIRVGDIFLKDGTPGSKRVGHAITVVDMAENSRGDKAFMLAQSYMPAQQPQILVNKNNDEIGPWYSLKEVKEMGKLKTPQWTFELYQLARFN